MALSLAAATQIAILVCLLASAMLVAAERKQWQSRRAVFKIIASTAFIAVAILQDATATYYGYLILAALILSWFGDVFLLSRKNRLFLIGIASFLLSHIVFSIAFAQRPLSLAALAAGLAIMGCLGIFVLKWLWPHLQSFYRMAVSAYVIAIVAMCAFAIAASMASGNYWLATGALALAASDISVARDRFVTPGFVNRAWGLPLYYFAQIVLALSVSNAYIGSL